MFSVHDTHYSIEEFPRHAHPRYSNNIYEMKEKELPHS